MDTELQPENSNKLFLPKEVLQVYGCKSCIWKSYGQCPHKHELPARVRKDGYCTELGTFILGLGEPGDSPSAIKEKFFIYTQEMQAMADNSEFHKLFKDIKEFRANSEQHVLELGAEEYKTKLGRMEMDMIASKIWWSRLTDSVVKSLARIADRESRSKDVSKNKQLNVQELNVILQDSAKVLLEEKNGNKG